jgi:hypothetical protein
MSSVTVAASAARYRRGAATARERSRLASNHGAVDRCDLTDDDPLFSAGVRGSRIGMLLHDSAVSRGDNQLCLASAVYVNADARMILPMGEHGFLPKQHGFLPKRLRVVDVKDLTRTPQSGSTSV